MQFVVFGASGATGIHLVEQALAAGHHVTAVARRPETLPFSPHERLTVRAGDLLDADSVARAIGTCDAVLSAAGPRDRAPTTIYSAGAHHMVAAMRRVGVRRLVVVSALGLDDDPDLPFPVSFVMKHIVKRLFREAYADGKRMEAELSTNAHDIEWTSVRATGLNNGKRTGRVRSAINARLHHPVRLSRADLAGYVLDIVGDAATYRAWTEPAW